VSSRNVETVVLAVGVVASVYVVVDAVLLTPLRT
jgi:hypothetical protein